MIKAIIFDCFGVLTGDKWKEFAATLTPEQRLPAGELIMQLDAGHIDKDEFTKKVIDLTGASNNKVQSIINPTMHKNTDLLSYIASLKSKYKIGLLSNASSRWIHDFLSEPELALFDDVVLSFEVKMTKHNPEIFDLALKRLGVEANKTAFIDDNQNYVDTANQKGISAILYQDFVQMKKELENILASH